MANSIITYPGNGVTTQFALNFTLGILDREHVKCRVGSEVDGLGDPVYRTLEWVTDGLVNVQGTVPAVGQSVVFTRTVPKDELVHDYENGAAIEESNLDDSNKQSLMAIHEFLDGRLEGGFAQDLTMNGFKITDLGDGVADTDAANMRQLNVILTDPGFIVVRDDLIGPDNIGTVADAIDAVEIVAGIDDEVVEVASISPEVENVSAISAAIVAVEANSANINAVAANNANINTTVANMAAIIAAPTEAANAAASAAAAAASAAEGLYNDVITITSANSPYTPTAAQEGTLFRCDTTSGAITINLSTLATYNEDMKFGFVKVNASANNVTVNRGGSDTISGATSVVLSTQYETHVVVGDLTSATWIDTVQTTGIADNSVTNTKLSDMAANTVKVRNNAASGDPADLAMGASTVLARLASGNIVPATLTQVLDLVGSAAQGDILYRNGSGWTRLPKGTAAQRLVMNAGATAPEWFSGDASTTLTASSSANLTFTLNAAYNMYEFEFDNLLPASSGQTLFIQISTDGGSTYISTGSTYCYSRSSLHQGGSIQIETSNASDNMTIRHASTDLLSNTAQEGLNGILNIQSKSGNRLKGQFQLSAGQSGTSGQIGYIIGVFSQNSTTKATHIRFVMSSGNLASGSITMRPKA